MAAALNALGRHLALTGFMGAGKTTVGARVAELLGRPFVDVDAAIETAAGRSIAEIFAADGESRFREHEQHTIAEVLRQSTPQVIALGGGALGSEATKAALADRAFTVVLDVDPAVAWERVSTSDRPLAKDLESFLRLFDQRQPLYSAVADARAADAEGVVLAAGGVVVAPGSLEVLGDHVPGGGPTELVADANVAGIHGVTAQLGLGARDTQTHEIPAGEAAKSIQVVDRLWRSIRLGRDGSIVALGGGCTTDVVGFAAATYMRGIAWIAVPTTLVGQVDAAIGGKTAIDVPGGKNLVGAFHWPARVVIDPALLETLPDIETANGLAEVVKTGLLAGQPLWELPVREQVRRCAAFKIAVCLADPHDHGPRLQLNLGHTFAHALEAAAGYELPHGQAVALGMLAALRLSGNTDGVETVERVLRPARVAVDADAAWSALARDKKARSGSPRLVLLEPGRPPAWGQELPETEIRRALEELIAS